ncbi:hypothetical protein FNF29_03631 [Cafeteria roenbergensis]|uniref:HP domain-containing protein n=1 Tax=Cafeteria roenbergensis TaxID=33653 RepID=A0A5A8CI64_CAFRO|nr:hypothetical protein FNF29_03631 [Cafeteria roenbergensis]|eukprot:KAA0152742.1 hypothetical protein FNF29_03631 [Cafeteria roenbergensis]
MDPQFEGLTIEEGIKIWRIENFEVVPVPEDQYGRFFEGDAYLIYAGQRHGPRIDSHVHFFLGKDCSQDESGTAALKAVELDQALGDEPIQHREVQNHESAQFLSYFRGSGGIEYLPGGVASGFTHVEPETYEPRLLHIKGRRCVRTHQAELSASSLNQGDVFVLDLGMKIFFWAGAEANRHEKGKAIEVMQRIDNSRGGAPERIVMADASEEEQAEFWAALGGSEADVQPAEAGGPDDGPGSSGSVKLLRATQGEDASLEVTPVELEDGKLERDMLEADGVFIVDAGNSVFAWVGSGASPADKKAALPMSQQYVQSQEDKPAWVSATVVRQHTEPPEFQSLFASWNPHKPFDFASVKSEGVAKALPQEAIDFAKINAPLASEAPLAGSDSATVRVWRVTDTEMTEETEEKFGLFFAGDSYVVHANGEFGDIIYFWLGKDSSSIEQGTAALQTVNLSDELGGSIPQVRVTQGREPPHFCALFKGGMIVRSGGASGEVSEEELAETALFHVKGSQPSTTKAVQVPAKASNLNSGDCFVLACGSASTVVWNGRTSSEEEQAVAAAVAERLASMTGSEVTVVEEGSEEEEFWEALGGKDDYPESLPGPPPPQPPRLFQVSTETGSLRVDEVCNFCQDDLLEDDVMMLDTFNQIFVWIGPGANETERTRAKAIAKEYLEAAGPSRDPEIPIIEMAAGSETPMFTSNFQGWETAKAKTFPDPYQAKLERIREEEEARRAKREADEQAAQERRAAAVAKLEAEQAEPEEAAAEPEEPEPEPEAEVEEAAAEPEEAAEAAPAAAAAASSGVDAEEAARIRNAADDSETKARLQAAEEERKATIAKLSAKAEPTMLPGSATFSLEELKECKERTEAMDIDLAKKELYLSDSDFTEVFGMSKDEFSALAKWKRDGKKKQAGLF